MSSRDETERLRRLRQEQIAATRDLLDALARERAALEAREGGALQAAVRDKQVLLERLGALEREPPAREAPDGLRDLEDELLALADRCRRQNHLNGLLLEASRRQAEELLAMLTGRAPERPATYDPRGETGARTGLQLHTRA